MEMKFLLFFADNPTDFLITTVQNLEKEMKLKDYSYQETMGMIAAVRRFQD